MSKRKPLPLPGQRIIRTAFAVWLCFVIYALRGFKGIPLFSALAAMQCIQPYTKDMKGVVKKRVLGTVLGAAWGLLMLLVEIRFLNGGVRNERLHYILVPLCLVAVLYSTVLLKVPETAYLTATVFLSIAINHFTDSNPYIFAFNRLLDTVIGALVASVVNRLHLPRRKETDTLFVSALGHSLLDSESCLSPFSLVELNRLIDDGMCFSLSTAETQATVRELLPGVRLNQPIITSDGAALYDMESMEYLKTTPMSEEKARRITAWLRERELPYFSNRINQNLLVIHYRDLPNEGMRRNLERTRHSAYRNYIRSDWELYRDVVYLKVVEESARLEAVRDELLEQPWIGDYRLDLRPEQPEGYSALKIYDAACSREAMLRVLETRVGKKRTLTFGGVPNKYDVYIENADRNLLVKELKRRFEPVDFRCWRSVFRW